MSKSTHVDFEEDELDDYIYKMDNLNIKHEEYDDHIYKIDELQRNPDREHQQNNNSKEKRSRGTKFPFRSTFVFEGRQDFFCFVVGGTWIPFRFDIYLLFVLIV